MKWDTSLGVRPSRALCGLWSLYSSRHFSISLFASSRFVNQFSFRHSSLSFPLKLSALPFWYGLPGWMYSHFCPRSWHHFRTVFEVNSVPLSLIISSGLPCSSINASNVFTTLLLFNELSTSIPKHFLLNTSMTGMSRIRLPSHRASCTKSKAHLWLGLVTTLSGFLNPRARFLPPLLRTFNPMLRYSL